jgi:hypothetical protein
VPSSPPTEPSVPSSPEEENVELEVVACWSCQLYKRAVSSHSKFRSQSWTNLVWNSAIAKATRSASNAYVEKTGTRLDVIEESEG